MKILINRLQICHFWPLSSAERNCRCVTWVLYGLQVNLKYTEGCTLRETMENSNSLTINTFCLMHVWKKTINLSSIMQLCMLQTLATSWLLYCCNNLYHANYKALWGSRLHRFTMLFLQFTLMFVWFWSETWSGSQPSHPACFTKDLFIIKSKSHWIGSVSGQMATREKSCQSQEKIQFLFRFCWVKHVVSTLPDSKFYSALVNPFNLWPLWGSSLLIGKFQPVLGLLLYKVIFYTLPNSLHYFCITHLRCIVTSLAVIRKKALCILVFILSV